MSASGEEVERDWTLELSIVLSVYFIERGRMGLVFYSESATKAISRQVSQSCKQMQHVKKKHHGRDEI